jgi:hypothetical protein
MDTSFSNDDSSLSRLIRAGCPGCPCHATCYIRLLQKRFSWLCAKSVCFLIRCCDGAAPQGFRLRYKIGERRAGRSARTRSRL